MVRTSQQQRHFPTTKCRTQWHVFDTSLASLWTPGSSFERSRDLCFPSTQDLQPSVAKLYSSWLRHFLPPLSQFAVPNARPSRKPPQMASKWMLMTMGTRLVATNATQSVRSLTKQIWWVEIMPSICNSDWKKTRLVSSKYVYLNSWQIISIQ